MCIEFVLLLAIDVFSHLQLGNCCDFSPAAAQGKIVEGDLILATTCDDKLIRIYVVDLSGASALLFQQLSGHTAKVFNATWSPLLPYTLASSSDDKRIGVWDLSSGLQQVSL